MQTYVGFALKGLRCMFISDAPFFRAFLTRFDSIWRRRNRDNWRAGGHWAARNVCIHLSVAKEISVDFAAAAITSVTVSMGGLSLSIITRKTSGHAESVSGPVSRVIRGCVRSDRKSTRLNSSHLGI